MSAAQRTWDGLLGLGIAGALVIVLRGFTVDDALISARYAAHVAGGLGHAFNPRGPISDGVTPLPWPYLLAPFAHQGPVAALVAAKWMGAVAWLVSTLLLSLHIGSIAGPRWSVGHPAMIVAFGTPAVAAWSVSGMETGLALAACTLAAIAGATPRWRLAAPACLGLACSLRPELLPFSLTLTLGCAFDAADTPSRAKALAKFVPLAVGPFVIVTLVRLFVFGSAAPLALRAKPSDLQHGLIYAGATLLISGPPLAVFAPLALRHLKGWPRWLLVAFGVHTATCIAVGGDWMPLSRLFVPVLPSLAIVFAHLARNASTWSTALRAGLCILAQAFVMTTVGITAGRVQEDRGRLIDHLRPCLHEEDNVATVDIGWVGAAHTGQITDLAGVTDPHVAALAGGHTSKRIPAGIFDARGVSHLVVLLPQSSDASAKEAWDACDLSRSVEVRICRMTTVHERFEIVEEIVATPKLRYVLLRRTTSL